MIDVTDEEFEAIVGRAIDNIPPKYGENIQNLGFVIEDEPNQVQRQKLHLHDGMTLFGLYEGVPLTRRGTNYSGVLPDKITIFKLPMIYASGSKEELEKRVDNTVWHEVAHYFGLDHDQIYKLDGS